VETTRNEQNVLDVLPNTMAPGRLTGPLHISVTRWFFTHSSGSGVGVGGTSVGGGGIVGTDLAAGIGGLITPVQADTSTVRRASSARIRVTVG
jgi:hypothetical protein